MARILVFFLAVVFALGGCANSNTFKDVTAYSTERTAQLKATASESAGEATVKGQKAQWTRYTLSDGAAGVELTTVNPDGTTQVVPGGTNAPGYEGPDLAAVAGASDNFRVLKTPSESPNPVGLLIGLVVFAVIVVLFGLLLKALPRRFFDRLQAIPKPVLYLTLIVATTVPLFVKLEVPNVPIDSSTAFYNNVMALQEGDRVLIASDWTNSTRGESKGEFEALMKILMRKGVKFAVYTTADAQAPQVARNAIRRVADLEGANGRKKYIPFTDYVVMGFFPNAEGTLLGINTNVLATFKGKKDFPPGQPPRDVLESPVFEGVKNLSDFKYILVCTGSKTSEITIERIDTSKIKLMFMVTGVMVPETRNYFTSGQIIGLVGGVKGVYDLETLMEKDFPGQQNAGQGTAYYLSLHFAIALLILVVVIGNIAMFMVGKARAR